ncbi:MAG: twin-arginine translocase subunit TatC [Acidobacteriota bacterium]
MRKGRKSPDEMTFLEHLEDLRKRLWYSFLAIFIALIPAYIFSKDVYELLSRPLTRYLPEGERLAVTRLPEAFMLYIKVAFITALFAVSPFVFYQIWLFVAPGLYQKEKKYVIPFVLFTTIFFIGGALFGYFIAYPFTCRFFLNMSSGFKTIFTANEYFGLTLKVLLGIGLAFELPTLIFFLSRMGIVTSRWMIRNFKYAVLAIFVIAAVITPSPDMITQSILAGPMLALYGLGILVAFFFGKERKARKARKAEPEVAG